MTRGRHRRQRIMRARPALCLLTAAQVSGQTGSWAALVAALPLALSRPDPGVWLALVTAAWGAPAAAAELPWITGRLIDHRAIGPRRAGALSWAIAAAAAAAVIARPGLPVTIAALCLISAARGIAVVAGDTAPSWLPRQPDLGISAAWLMLGATVPVMIGPLGSAALLQYWGTRWSWAATAVLFAAGTAASAPVPAVRPPGSPAAAGGRGAAGARMAGLLAVTAGVWLTYGAMEILQPLWVQDGLHSSLLVYGWTMVANAVAGTAVSLAAIWRTSPLRRVIAWPWTVPLAALVVAAGERQFTATGSVPVAMAGSALWGAGAALFTLASKQVIVTRVPKAAHGRAFTGWRAVQNASYMAPAAVVGQLTGSAGLPAVLAGVCVLAAVSGAGYGIASCILGGRAARPSPRAGLAMPRDPAPGLAGPAQADGHGNSPGQGTPGARRVQPLIRT